MTRPNLPIRRTALLLAFALVLAPVRVPSHVHGQTSAAIDLSGDLNGAAYRIQVPANWNGTLLLYSHGYVLPGGANPARDAPDPVSAAWLLSNGYALAGSAYASTGWAVEDALPDQIALLDLFDQEVGTPSRTIAWGQSLGGLVTAGLVERYPDRFSGALPMCGVLSGGVATWNTALDSAFAFKTLLAPDSSLQLVNINDPNANLKQALALLDQVQQSPQGQARLALAAALNDLPGWFDATGAAPAQDDVQTREQQQVLWDQFIDFPFAFALRADLEQRAGGNPSGTTGVDFAQQLALSPDRDEVITLYQQAGLSLDADLRALDAAPPVTADPGAAGYLAANVTPNGAITVPVLTLHTTGDGLVPVENEQSYAQQVNAMGTTDLLRQIYIDRAGHCTFTPAERLTALHALVARLDSGTWDAAENIGDLNYRAATLAANLSAGSNSAALFEANVAFVTYQPAEYPRLSDTPSGTPP